MSTVIQNVTGAGNAVSGTGDVYQVNYHLDHPTAEHHRNLRNLLGEVKRTWITGVLDHSVHGTALPELGMRPEPGAVEHPWERVLEMSADPGVVLPAGRTIHQVFEDVGRLLLILGEPGSGKTTTLLTLARECVHQAERDPTAPIPVVLSLSTWAESRNRIHDWLVSELGARYVVGAPLARRWLQEHRLLLLLDGLDEVAEDRRAECVSALHDFVRTHGVPGLVVCCRAAEYRRLPARLKLRGAVQLQPLTWNQARACLDAAGPELAELRNALSHSAELRALAESPLMLSIMTLAFRRAPPEALRFEDATTPAALRDRIFNAYVERMFARRARDGRPEARKQIERSLRWLSTGMAARGQSVFSIDYLQPAGSLTSRKQLFAYALLSRVLAGAILMMILCALAAVVPILDGWSSTSWERLSDWGLTLALLTLWGMAAGIAAGILCFVADFARLSAPKHGGVTNARRTRTFLNFLLYTLMGVGGCLFALAVLQSLGEDFTFAAVFLTLPTAPPIFAFFFGVKQGRGDATMDIGSAGVLRWQWEAARAKTVVGILLGAVGGFLLLFLGVPHLTVIFCPALGGAIGLLFGGWGFGVPPVDVRPGHQRNTRLINALKGTLFSGGLGALLGGLLQVLFNPTSTTASALLLAAIGTSMSSCVIAFLWLGGIDLILHASLRLVIAVSGNAPLRLRRLLDDSVGLVFLQRAGAGYMFIHRLLLEHFAADGDSSRQGR